jgi:hypothetical protein
VLRLRDRPHASDFIVAEAATDTTVAEVSIWAGTTVADLRKSRRLGTIAKRANSCCS